jgi:hypothetical protein
MKTNFLLRAILFVMIAGLLSLNCSPTGTSNVTIHINLGLDNKATLNAPESSIFDRIFRLFAKDAEAQIAAPSNITSLTLNITSSGTELIPSLRYTSPDIPSSISVEVPAGSARMFEVLVSIDPSDPGTILSYRGTATRDLTSGETVDIPIDMGLYETKIVIPESYSGNYRIVQINNMSGAGWSVRSTISGIGNLRPYDIDFDNQGRIYIANNFAGTGDDVIIRIDNIGSSNVQLIGTGNSSGFYAVAVDRVNNYLYGVITSANTIRQYTLDGTLISQITLPSISFTTIRGLAVDIDGSLYISATTTSGTVQEVIKCTPGNPSTDVIRYSSGITLPLDVAVKDNYVYVANFDSLNYSNDKIVQLNNQLQFQSELLTNLGNSDHFYGPHRFLAILNRKFYIIDDGRDLDGTPSFNMDRIIAFDDMSGASWETYGSTGSGTGQFNFYEYYIC